MLELDKKQWVQAIKEAMQNQLPVPDSRADIAIQQTDTDSEIQLVIANVRACNGDVRWIDEGEIMTYTNNKVSLFQIMDYLDTDDNVLDYEVQLMQTQLNGVNVDVSDEIDIDDVRDMNNFFFKIRIYMIPEVVMFDPVYVDDDEIINDAPEYVVESNVTKYISWKGALNETYTIFEAKGKTGISIKPPVPTNAEVYFDINKFNVDSAAADHADKKMIQDMGFTLTNYSKNAELDYEMHGAPQDLYVYDIEAEDGKEKIELTEMLNTIMEKCEDVVYATDDEQELNEIKRKAKMNSKGKKRIKMQCAKGFKYDNNRRVCVKITGSEMMDMRRQHKRANRTKKALGRGHELRRIKKFRKANKFRKMQGMRNGQTM